MRVTVKSSDAKIPLIIILPSRLVFNPVSAAIGAHYTELSPSQLHALMRACIKAKKALKGKPLVEAVGEDGDRVRVYL